MLSITNRKPTRKLICFLQSNILTVKKSACCTRESSLSNNFEFNIHCYHVLSLPNIRLQSSRFFLFPTFFSFCSFIYDLMQSLASRCTKVSHFGHIFPIHGQLISSIEKRQHLPQENDKNDKENSTNNFMPLAPNRLSSPIQPLLQKKKIQLPSMKSTLCQLHRCSFTNHKPVASVKHNSSHCHLSFTPASHKKGRGKVC